MAVKTFHSFVRLLMVRKGRRNVHLRPFSVKQLSTKAVSWVTCSFWDLKNLNPKLVVCRNPSMAATEKFQGVTSCWAVPATLRAVLKSSRLSKASLSFLESEFFVKQVLGWNSLMERFREPGLWRAVQALEEMLRPKPRLWASYWP